MDTDTTDFAEKNGVFFLRNGINAVGQCFCPGEPREVEDAVVDGMQ